VESFELTGIQHWQLATLLQSALLGTAAAQLLLLLLLGTLLVIPQLVLLLLVPLLSLVSSHAQLYSPHCDGAGEA
jgi:hypothetical protein